MTQQDIIKQLLATTRHEAQNWNDHIRVALDQEDPYNDYLPERHFLIIQIEGTTIQLRKQVEKTGKRFRRNTFDKPTTTLELADPYLHTKLLRAIQAEDPTIHQEKLPRAHA